MSSDAITIRPRLIVAWAAAVAGVVAIVIALIISIGWGFSAFGRYNARQNAKNQVGITKTQIKTQEQLVLVEQGKANVRIAAAVGVKGAQDEIAKTLTPLYVQYEMTQALMQIAISGKNNSVVYLPSGANGIPLVDDVSVDKVGKGDGG